MKNLLIVVLALIPGLVFAKTPAQTVQLDVAGLQLTNFCAGETVTVTDGQLHIVYRLDFGGDINGVHLLNKVAGSFSALGDASGNEYLVNIAGQSPNLLPGVSFSNYVNEASVAGLMVHVEQINLSDPGSGVSQVKAVILFGVDGTGTGTQRVLEVSMGCAGT